MLHIWNEEYVFQEIYRIRSFCIFHDAGTSRTLIKSRLSVWKLKCIFKMKYINKVNNKCIFKIRQIFFDRRIRKHFFTGARNFPENCIASVAHRPTHSKYIARQLLFERWYFRDPAHCAISSRLPIATQSVDGILTCAVLRPLIRNRKPCCHGDAPIMPRQRGVEGEGWEGGSLFQDVRPGGRY